MNVTVTAALEADAGDLLRCDVHRLQRIRGGGNNELYRLETSRGTFALKRYIVSADDSRDRIGHEYDALTFLADAGETAVPRPIAADRVRQLAVYEWIDGAPVTVFNETDAAAGLAFLERLYASRTRRAAAILPDAVEACIDAGSLEAEIARRLLLLEAAGTNEPLLPDFLRCRFRPALKQLAQAAGDVEPVSRPFATLSPSDFGTHNMLRRPDGSLVFLDFEYFGWDDPVKLVADAVWHPGSALSASIRERFVRGARQIFGDDPEYGRRFEARAPLFALRWALIVLSEFVPERWERRRRAGEAGDWAAVKERQLAKAIAFVHAATRS